MKAIDTQADGRSGPEPAPSPRFVRLRRMATGLGQRSPALLMAALLLLSLGVRLQRSHHGLPYIDHWDEPSIGNRSLLMLQSGDLNPHFFRYPSLLIYLNLGVDIAHYLHLAGLPESHPDALGSLDELEVGSPTGDWYLSHPSFYVWKRGLVSLFGTASLIAAALFAASMSGARAAPLLAVLLLGTLPFHIWHSSVVTTDVPSACLAAFSVLFCLRFERHQRPAELLAAAALAGLAASTKYNLGTVFLFALVCLALAAWRRSSGYRPWLWLALPMTTGAAFFAGTPYSLFDLRSFVDDVAYEVHHYVVAGHRSASTDPGWPHLRLDLLDLVENLGWLPLLLGVGGLALSLRRSGGWLLIAAPLLQLLLTARTTVHFHRNLMLLYPFLAAGFGIGTMAVVQAVQDRLRDPLWRRRSSIALLLVVAVWGGLEVRRALSMGMQAVRARDSRSQVADALRRFYPGKEAWLASELRWHPRDLRRFDNPYVLMPALEVLCRPRPPGTLAVSAVEYHYHRPQGRPFQVALNRAVGDVSAARLLGSGATWIERYSVDPRIAIWEGPTARERDVCAILSPSRLAEGSAGRIEGRNVWLPDGRTVQTAAATVFPAAMALTWNEKDLTGDRPGLDVEVVFTPVDGERSVVLAERTYRTRPSGMPRTLPFRIEEPGAVAVHLRVSETDHSGDAVWVRKLEFSFLSDGPPPRQP